MSRARSPGRTGRRVRRGVVAATLVASWLAGCASLPGGPTAALVAGYDWAGLDPIDMAGIDYAAVDTLTDFGSYSQLIVDPVAVAFDEDWAPLRPASAFEYGEKDLDALREFVGGVVRAEFVDGIRQGGRFAVVDTPGPGVLQVRLALVEVQLNAPDLPTATRTEQFARSAGEWTLVAELVDARSGALVGRLVDRWEDPEEQYLRRMTRVENAQALRRATESWVRAIRRHLEVAGIRNRMEGAGEGLRPTGGR